MVFFLIEFTHSFIEPFIVHLVNEVTEAIHSGEKKKEKYSRDGKEKNILETRKREKSYFQNEYMK